VIWLWLIEQQIVANPFTVPTVGSPWDGSGRLDRSQTFLSHDFKNLSTTDSDTLLLQGFLDSLTSVAFHVPNKFDPDFVLWAVVFLVRVMTFSTPVSVRRAAP
jgi:hypothetical protein